MKKAFATLALMLLLALHAGPVFAQANPGAGVGNPGEKISFKIENPFKVGNNLFELIEALVKDIILPVGGILCVLGFIWSGFMYVKAQGKPAEITKANNAFLYTAIGTAILLGAWVIAELIQNTLTKILS